MTTEEEYMERFLTKVDMESSPDGCWLWTGTKNTFGYGEFNYRTKHFKAHRFAYIQAYGEIPIDLVIRHKCRGLCVNPEHLEIGTKQDNSNDMIRDGTSGKGSLHSQSKLTEDQVLEIRAQESILQKDLAIQYGVSVQTINDIIKRRAWKHV